MKSLIFATVALVVIGGAGLLVAQNEDHALRLWLIDRIERAYVDGDAEALRRMAKHEYEHDIGEWLKRQPIGTTSAVSGRWATWPLPKRPRLHVRSVLQQRQLHETPGNPAPRRLAAG